MWSCFPLHNYGWGSMSHFNHPVFQMCKIAIMYRIYWIGNIQTKTYQGKEKGNFVLFFAQTVAVVGLVINIIKQESGVWYFLDFLDIFSFLIFYSSFFEFIGFFWFIVKYIFFFYLLRLLQIILLNMAKKGNNSIKKPHPKVEALRRS